MKATNNIANTADTANPADSFASIPAVLLLDGIWLLLLAGTGYTWWLGESTDVGHGAVLAMLAVVAAKGWLVIREFMALRGVAPLWQGVVTGWLVTVLAVNMVLYWKG